jgi:anti-anti-sigma factor
MGTAMWADDLVPYGVTLTFGIGRARIALAGEFDVATGAALVDATTSAVARYALVEIDLRDVTFLDSHGCRALLKVKRFADAYDSKISVVGVSEQARETIEFAGIGPQLGGLPPAG